MYVSGIGTPTEGIAGLREGVEKQESYIQDSADFLRELEGLGKLEEGEFLFTMDVVGLYPMVPRARAEEAMRKNLDSREIKTIPTEDLMELAKLVLDNNEFHLVDASISFEFDVNCQILTSEFKYLMLYFKYLTDCINI